MKNLMFTLNKHNAIWLLWLFLTYFIDPENLSGVPLWLTLLGGIIVLGVICLYRTVEVQNVLTLLGYNKKFAEKYTLMLELIIITIPIVLAAVLATIATILSIELNWELKLFNLLLCLFTSPIIVKMYIRKRMHTLQQ